MVPSERRLVDALRAALVGQPGHGTLEVHYQPVIGIRDGTPLGAEALARWVHPEFGRIAPDDFVGAAERAGLGARLDSHVLRTALAQVAAWDADGLRVHRVGVNLGRESMHSTELVETVLQACELSGAGPDRLMLEVVEHDQLSLTPPRLAAVQALADADITIALDDFGAGYSGVGLLARLPFGVLKIDRSLLPGVEPGARGAADSRAVLAGVLALARAVGVEVTAEGVETPLHRELLADLGVPHAQGWLYAPAMPADALAAWWREWAAAALVVAS